MPKKRTIAKKQLNANNIRAIKGKKESFMYSVDMNSHMRKTKCLNTNYAGDELKTYWQMYTGEIKNPSISKKTGHKPPLVIYFYVSLCSFNHLHHLVYTINAQD